MRIDRALLTAALTLCTKIVATASRNLAILQYVRVTPETDGLRLQATDLDHAASLALPSDGATPGPEYCVPAKKFLELVKALPKGEKGAILLFDAATSYLSIGVAKLATLPVDDFPNVVPFEKFEETPIALEAIDAVAHVMSHDESRYALNSVMYDNKAGIAIATDGHRLHTATFRPGKSEPVLIPRPVVDLLLEPCLKKLGQPEAIRVTTPVDQVYALAFPFRYGVLLSRGSTAVFPNYQQVVPKEENCPGRFTINKALFEQAIASTKPYWDRSASIVLDLDPDRPALYAYNTEIGQAEFEIPGTYTGPIAPFGINARYLLDALKGFPGEKITLFIKDGVSPLMARDERQTVTSVIMPMRVDYKGYRAAQKADEAPAAEKKVA